VKHIPSWATARDLFKKLFEGAGKGKQSAAFLRRELSSSAELCVEKPVVTFLRRKIRSLGHEILPSSEIYQQYADS
jgi:hypothetical protein